MSDRLRVGVTHDFVDESGRLVYRDFEPAIAELDSDRAVDWEFIPEDLREVTPDVAARYDAIVSLRPRYSAATFARDDRRLALVSRFGVGYDMIDVEAASRAGCLIAITPDGVRRPVAQAVLTFILALAGQLLAKDRLTRAGEGWARAAEFMGMGVTGRTLGLIGVGNIGRDVVHLVRPFEMKVIAHDPYAAAVDGVTLVDLETLFRESDFVSVNCPLTAQTRHLVNARLLGMMKPSAYLINTARGPIVDEAALYEALASKRIAGAGIDVFEEEPTPAANPLLRLDNIIVTPHALCWTDECFRGNGQSAVRAVLDLAHGRVPSHIVNRSALETPWLKRRLEEFNRATA